MSGLWGQRTRADDLAEREPVPSREHVHFHEHDGSRHAHTHTHIDDSWMHAHSHLTTPPAEPIPRG